ncbi:MAG: sigma-54-dependent Fis family transcriptional regulator [Methylococcales bacterium]|nr:sigma-54-dependent Fis family transcriptional regulator [Methylococcales bacterium]
MSHFNLNIGKSPVFEALIRNAKIIAGTDVTVLIKGETGTGKEVLANAIQKHSTRADKPFIILNCAALSESLIESALFGHKKGAFTGAIENKQGLLQSANEGTLFLDEVNSLPLSIQAKLLRFLESGDCLPVGETKPYKVNVRVISATNMDLAKKISTGKFRQDLFFRLNIVPIELPSLKQRTEDIELLVKHFLFIYAEKHSTPPPKLSKRTIKVLKSYNWPGNIRELRNLCERLSILLAGKIIEPENLPLEFIKHTSTSKAVEFILPKTGLNLDALEIDMINQALIRTKGNRSQSARLLGISRDTLLYRIKKYNLAIA